jgi:cell division protein FtsL
MTEYHTVKRIDNSRLVRFAPPAELKDFWRKVGVGAALAACLLFYAWQHFECIQIRYRIERLDAQRARVAELNEQLHLEVATLRSPMRVDAIARNQLGLTFPVPGQVSPAQGTGNAMLADAHMLEQVPQP